MNGYESLTDAIGATPLIRLVRLTEGIAAPVYVKAEFLGPGGSVKDRAARQMILAAERDGSLARAGLPRAVAVTATARAALETLGQAAPDDDVVLAVLPRRTDVPTRSPAMSKVCFRSPRCVGWPATRRPPSTRSRSTCPDRRSRSAPASPRARRAP